jgi:hypothetical protein
MLEDVVDVEFVSGASLPKTGIFVVVAGDFYPNGP